ncbi:MAG: glutamate-1-semialdehyde 2,1-aminomutase [Eubacterium sp.]|nr:glutamate-1-semialdehyde 2,1-aminomutase [Eubacterium sp.]
MKTDRSSECYKRAVEFMPGGVNSPVRAFGAVGRDPVFIDREQGDRIYDIDGNCFIDYVGSWGPMILGHAHPDVTAAVKKAADRGLSYGAPTAGETDLAMLIRKGFPVMERLRLVSSGTEAVMSAIRTARGYTGRDKIVKFNGCYHGHSDSMLVKAGSGLLTGGIPDSAGVPSGVGADTLVIDYNSVVDLEWCFQRNRDDIACVIIEPVAANMGVVPPQGDFLRAVREITARNGALLIFDEVITGFRLSFGGACEYYGIEPDMVCLGKIVGGGMPLAVYGGKKEIMEVVAPLGAVYQAGTLSGNPVAVAAGTATLDILYHDKSIYDALDQKGAAIEEAFLSTGLVQVNRVGSLLSAFFTDTEVTDHDSARASDTDKYSAYFSYMLEHGIYVAPSQFEAMFIGAAHTDEDIRTTVEAITMFKA